MIKKVLFGSESREKILAGVQKITKAVSITMGAAGKCCLIGEAVYGNDGIINLPTKVSKDGWTVAKHFDLPDAVEQRGALMVREAAERTVIEAGDSTTLTCVLAESLITNGMKLIDEGANSQQLKKGMDAALVYVIEELQKISTPLKGDLKKIKQIATVSANNDDYIGQLIADAYEKIGDEGIIDIEASNGTSTEIKISDGFKIDRGWISPLFVNNGAKETCEFENALILLYDKKINHHTQIEKAVAISNQQNKPLLIICEDAIEEGLAFLGINNYQKRFRVCAVKSPEFGDAKRDWMEDIALITGASYFSDLHGLDINDDMDLSLLGTAEKVIVTNNETVIRGGNKGVKYDEFLADLQMNLTRAKTEDEKYPIEKRIARLKSSVATIQVGAATETELKEKLDRVDDAVRATKAAIAEGFVAGGGTAFLRIPIRKAGISLNIDALRNIDLGNDEKMSEEEIIKIFNQQGSQIWSTKTAGVVKLNLQFGQGGGLLAEALMRPLLQICENAGVDSLPILKIVLLKEKNIGYNVLTEKIEDMVEAGIIDSTKALRCALTNAVSVAGMVLTSECSIVSTS